MANRFKDIVFSVETLVDLALCSGLTDGQVAEVIGGADASDGLGGQFRCVLGDATPPDGVDIIDGPNCKWFRIVNGIQSASNVGQGGAQGGHGIFKQADGPNLEFKSLVAGDNVVISQTANTIVLSGAPSTTSSLAPASATETIHVYVAPTGNDENEGTSASPKATLAGAYQLLPLIQTGPFIVHVASGSYDYVPPPPNTQTCVDAFICIWGDGAEQGVDDGFTVVATGTAEVGTTDGIVKATGLTTDQYAYRTIEFTSGACAGNRRVVCTNSATDIYVSLNLTATPAVGDAYRIIRPGAIFTTSTNNVPFGSCELVKGETQLHFVNLALTGVAVNTGLSSFMDMYGVELGVQLTCLKFTVLSFGANAGEFPLYLPAAIGMPTATWEGWGLTSTVTNANSLDSSGSAHGYISAAGYLNAGVRGLLYLRGGRCASFISNRNSQFIVYCPLPIFIIAKTGATPTIYAQVSSETTIYSELNISCTIDVNTVYVENGAFVWFYHQGGTSPTHTITTTATTKAAISVAASGSFSSLKNLNITASNTVGLDIMGSFEQLGTTTVNSFNTFGMRLRQSARALFVGAVSLTGTQVAISTEGGAVGTFTGNVTTNSGAAFQVSRASKVTFDGTANTFTQSGTSNVSRVSNVNFANVSFNGGGLILNGSGKIFCSGTFYMTGAITAGTLVMDGQTSASLVGTTTIANTGTGDAVRCSENAQITFQLNPTISSTAAYGVNCRGGGRVMLRLAPTNVTGTVSAFTVGTGAGEDFPQTDLAASYSFKQAGPSLIGRSS